MMWKQYLEIVESQGAMVQLNTTGTRSEREGTWIKSITPQAGDRTIQIFGDSTSLVALTTKSLQQKCGQRNYHRAIGN